MLHGGQQFAARHGRLTVAGKERRQGHDPSPGGSGDLDRRVEREQQGRRVADR